MAGGSVGGVGVFFNGDGSVTISDNGAGISVVENQSAVPFLEEMTCHS